jgi:hypothetical protein
MRTPWLLCAGSRAIAGSESLDGPAQVLAIRRWLGAFVDVARQEGLSLSNEADLHSLWRHPDLKVERRRQLRDLAFKYNVGMLAAAAKHGRDFTSLTARFASGEFDAKVPLHNCAGDLRRVCDCRRPCHH